VLFSVNERFVEVMKFSIDVTSNKRDPPRPSGRAGYGNVV